MRMEKGREGKERRMEEMGKEEGGKE